jgi:DNA-binding NarL/FixJ family response regulator
MTATAPSEERKRKIRVFLVDDHPVVISGMSALIDRESDMEVCGSAGTVSEGIQKISAWQPDVSIVDISLPDETGIELTRKIHSSCPDTHVLVLSMHDDHIYAERALRAGASGYIRKAQASDIVVEAIRQVTQGEVYLSDRTTSHLLSHLVGTGSHDPLGSIESFSDRELQVFELMGQGLANREIARKCHLSVKTVESYFRRIKDKLHVEKTSELRKIAITWIKNRPVV